MLFIFDEQIKIMFMLTMMIVLLITKCKGTYLKHGEEKSGNDKQKQFIITKTMV
jgi:hypothetical protein